MKKGISLVALVITIIVLIILTAAVILTATNTNIFSKANEAKEAQNRQEVYDAVQREVLDTQLQMAGQGISQEFATNLQQKLNAKYPEANAQVSYENGKITIGYTLSGKTYELELNDKMSLAIKNNDGNLVVPEEPVTPGNGEHTPISTGTSYVGYYADINADGQVDGIIYADLLHGVTGQWGGSSGTFSYASESVSGMKSYYISQENYISGTFDPAPVISPMGSGTDRFYVMALQNIDNNAFYSWYVNANIVIDSWTEVDDETGEEEVFEEREGIMEDWETYTSISFGSGRENTSDMINKWNNEGYGERRNDDLWGHIATQVNNGWYVPSKEELCAFLYNLNITLPDIWREHNIGSYIWSSSQASISAAWWMAYPNMECSGMETTSGGNVRLSTNF